MQLSPRVDRGRRFEAARSVLPAILGLSPLARPFRAGESGVSAARSDTTGLGLIDFTPSAAAVAEVTRRSRAAVQDYFRSHTGG